MSIGSRKIISSVMKTKLRTMVNKNEFPKIFSALSGSFFPKLIEILLDAPAPTSIPNAAIRFITGNVTANPEIANAPTPCPMNMRSTMLYVAFTIVPTIAGSA